MPEDVPENYLCFQLLTKIENGFFIHSDFKAIGYSISIYANSKSICKKERKRKRCLYALCSRTSVSGFVVSAPQQNGESTGFSFGRAQSVEGQGGKNLYRGREIDRVFVFGSVIARRAGRWRGTYRPKNFYKSTHFTFSRS